MNQLLETDQIQDTAQVETQPAAGSPARVQPASVSPHSPLAKRGRGFTGTQLKILAIATMALDHIGAIALLPLIMAMPQNTGLTLLMMVLRCLGRLAFPIFCFLLVEGFLHTSNVKRYALRLAAFAAISEIPFDLALNNTWLEGTYQNVLFTLLFGLLAIWAIDALRGRLWLQIPAVLICVAMAQIIRTDYAGMGVVTIVLFYVLRNHKKAMFWAVGLWLWLGMVVSSLPQMLAMRGSYPAVLLMVAALSSGLMEVLGAFSFLFLARYNGERGAKLPKYLFYAFYPAHLLLLFGIAQLFTVLLG